jgi:hypothetical protein
MEYIKTIDEAVLEIEPVQVNLPVLIEQPDEVNRSFIIANTVEGNLYDLQNTHLIPVFVKDNQPLISHADFISVTRNVVQDYFNGVEISAPAIRVSHEIKGRIPSARTKPAAQLEEHEKTLYYERMMFCIELPGVQDMVDGNLLSLTIGGVKSYAQDSLYSRKGDEHFKVFVGYQNRVCTNLCISTDGLLNELKVTTIGQLKACIYTLLQDYNQRLHLSRLKRFAELSISEHQFAQLIGRCRMFPHLPAAVKKHIPQLQYGDAQMGTVVRDYYSDISFCRNDDGRINLWKLYNLFTGANKSTYIDKFLDRSVNAFSLVEQVQFELEGKSASWYLS